jgi:uncharacterized repeat protein (TIGR01451 family)
MRARTARSILAAIGAVVISTAVAAGATPAFADTGSINADASDMTIAANGGPGKVYPLTIFGGGLLTNPKVVVDFSGIDGIATPSFPDPSSGCSVSGSSATCSLADVPDGQELDLTIPLKLTPAAGAKDGVTASFTVSASADGVDPNSATVNVDVIDGPDLVLPGTTTGLKAKPGDHVTLPISVANAGSKPANGVLFLFQMSHGIQPDSYDNCLYADWPEDDGTYVLCEIDDTLAPGQTWDINPSMSGVVPSDSANEARADLMVGAVDDSDVSSALKHGALGLNKMRLQFVKRASGKSLRADADEANADDVDPGDNFATWDFDIDTAYDMVANGAQVVGSPGDLVKVKLGSTDNGPASIDFWSVHDFAAGIQLTVPAWADVVGVPTNCQAESSPDSEHLGSKPGYPFYGCSSDSYFLQAHHSFAVTFTFKIKSSSGKDGSVDLPKGDSFGLNDTNHANDMAPVTLSAPGTPSLPITGAKAGLIGGAGAVLVALGVLLVIGARRRKATTLV